MQRLRLTIAASRLEADLTDFPLHVLLPASYCVENSGALRFVDANGTVLPHVVDVDEGSLSAWVRLPLISASEETIFFAERSGVGSGPGSFEEVFSRSYRFVGTAGSVGATDKQIDEGSGDGTALTIESWIHVDESRAEQMQLIASQWPLAGNLNGFATYDAGNTDGLETKGFFGAMCDGRYIYFSPQCNTTGRHGTALRYDTHGDFHDRASWAGYEAGETGGMETRGYYGVICTGRYVYYVPRHDGSGEMHTKVLRFDAQGGDFRDPAAWSAFDIGLSRTSQGCACDGRYIYFVPGYAEDKNGLVIRYDTTAPFDARGSYETYDALNTSGVSCFCYDGALFDGRHIYFAPLTATGNALRYDTRMPFQEAASWEARSILAATDPAIGACVGAVFDGRYVYYVPYGDNSAVVRYDTQQPFDDDKSWEGRD